MFDCLVIDVFNRGHLSRLSIDRRSFKSERGFRPKARRAESAFLRCRAENSRIMSACTEGTPTFRSFGGRSWLSKVECTLSSPLLSPLSSMLRICTTVRCGGHNDRGWSLCLSCKSRGNFERLFRPARLACACLPCPVLRSSLPVPTQNRWVGDRLVIKRSFARATFSQATKEKRGGGGGRGGNGGSSYDGNVPFPAVVQFPNHFIAPPRRAGCLSFRSRPCK